MKVTLSVECDSCGETVDSEHDICPICNKPTLLPENDQELLPVKEETVSVNNRDFNLKSFKI